MKITTHTIVKNEQQFIKPALLSVIDHVSSMLVWDTGSTDKTVKIIKSIKSKKIKFKAFKNMNRQQLVNLRNQQIQLTQTSWFLILDGDEIWPEKNLQKLLQAIQKARPDTIALVNKTRNSVKDIYHYLPQSKGDYHIGPWHGHLNIRAIKNLPDLQVTGLYPNEAYTFNQKPIQDHHDKLEFVNTWYLHTTHLKRTSWIHSLNVIDRLKKFKNWGNLKKLKKSELPPILQGPTLKDL